MFQVLKEIHQYILSDYYRYYGSKPSLTKMYVKGIISIHSAYTYNFWMRLSMKKGHPFYYLARVMLRHYMIKFGIQIPCSTNIGYGLMIGHGMGVVINPLTQIGNNCNLSQFVTIGSNHDKGAIIGDNVYIGPSVCIVEDVKIGNNVTIGAGSVVVKDIPNNATVAGVPAKILSFKEPGRYINRRYTAEV